MTRLGEMPRAGTRAYRALAVLYALTGKATIEQWAEAAKREKIRLKLDQELVDALLQQDLIFLRGYVYSVTDDGCELLGHGIDAAPTGGMALPRVAPHQRPLSRVNMPRMDLAREGSLDYRDIPSRIGEHLIMHRKA